MEFLLKVSLKGGITCEREITTLSWSRSTIQKITVSVQSTTFVCCCCLPRKNCIFITGTCSHLKLTPPTLLFLRWSELKSTTF